MQRWNANVASHVRKHQHSGAQNPPPTHTHPAADSHHHLLALFTRLEKEGVAREKIIIIIIITAA